MRRAVLALTVGSVLLAAAACGTATSPTAHGTPAVGGTPAPAGAAEQPVRAETKALCESLGRVYTENMGPFAQALSAMVAGKGSGGAKASQEQAQQKLSVFAAAVREATQASPDAKVRADGAKTADQLQAKSTDDKFFSKIQTSKDVQTVLGPTLKDWLSPVASHCS